MAYSPDNETSIKLSASNEKGARYPKRMRLKTFTRTILAGAAAAGVLLPLFNFDNARAEEPTPGPEPTETSDAPEDGTTEATAPDSATDTPDSPVTPTPVVSSSSEAADNLSASVEPTSTPTSTSTEDLTEVPETIRTPYNRENEVLGEEIAKNDDELPDHTSFILTVSADAINPDGTATVFCDFLSDVPNSINDTDNEYARLIVAAENSPSGEAISREVGEGITATITVIPDEYRQVQINWYATADQHLATIPGSVGSGHPYVRVITLERPTSTPSATETSLPRITPTSEVSSTETPDSTTPTSVPETPNSSDTPEPPFIPGTPVSTPTDVPVGPPGEGLTPGAGEYIQNEIDLTNGDLTHEDVEWLNTELSEMLAEESIDLTDPEILEAMNDSLRALAESGVDVDKRDKEIMKLLLAAAAADLIITGVVGKKREEEDEDENTLSF